MPRERPEVVVTRVLMQDKAKIRALAALQNVSVSEALYRVLLPAVDERLA